MNKETTRARTEEIVLIGFFLGALCFPLLGTAFHLDSVPLWENRQLAEFPRVSAKFSDVVQFPRRFGSYFKDHFAFRARLIRAQAIVRVEWLTVSTVSEVVVGKHGWLFYNDANSIASYTGSKPVTQNELARWQKLLEARQEWLKQRGIKFVFTVAPDKQTIYPEYMPDGQVRRTGASRLDDLIDYLRVHSDIRVLDLRPALFQSKQQFRVYYQTDSHWNMPGAFAAYRAISERLGETFPGLHHLSATDFEVVNTDTYSGDLAGMLGLHGVRLEDELSLRPKQPLQAKLRPASNAGEAGRANRAVAPVVYERDADLPRLVVFGDSFAGGSLASFLAEDFSRTVVFAMTKMDRSIVEAERPGVVIMEIVERDLINDPPDDLQSPAADPSAPYARQSAAPQVKPAPKAGSRR